MSIAQDELRGFDPAAHRDPAQPCKQGLTWAMRRLVLARDDFGCVCCDRSILSKPYSILLRKPQDLGGSISPENLITVLGECGERISSLRDPADEARGYVVRACDEPALVPVAYMTPAGQAKRWLSPDGSRSFEPAPESSGEPLQRSATVLMSSRAARQSWVSRLRRFLGWPQDSVSCRCGCSPGFSFNER